LIIVRESLKNGAHPNVPNRGTYFREPLQIAVEAGDVEIVRLLLTAGSNGQKSGVTALHTAVDRRMEDMVKLLLEYEADVTAANLQGDNLLHYAARLQDPNIFRLLLPTARNLNIGNEHQETPLYHACTWGNEEIVRIFVSSGAHVNSPTKNGHTVLHYIRCHDFEILELLLSHGADTSIADRDGKTVCMLCSCEISDHLVGSTMK
jgi:ankyrin repeat protein